MAHSKLSKTNRSPCAVTSSKIGSSLPCGPDLQTHRDAIRAYLGAGFDEVLISQIGPLQEDFFRFAAEELLPSLREE